KPLLPTNLSISDEDCAIRFHWWWRGLFVTTTSRSLAIGLDLPVETVIPRRIRWSAKPAVGLVFRGCYSEHQKSAFLYEVEKRVTGVYRFGKPWIKLNETHREMLRNLWPDRQRPIISRYSILPFERMDNWTEPVVASWNLNLNNQTLQANFAK